MFQICSNDHVSSLKAWPVGRKNGKFYSPTLFEAAIGWQGKPDFDGQSYSTIDNSRTCVLSYKMLQVQSLNSNHNRRSLVHNLWIIIHCKAQGPQPLPEGPRPARSGPTSMASRAWTGATSWLSKVIFIMKVQGAPCECHGVLEMENMWDIV